MNGWVETGIAALLEAFGNNAFEILRSVRYKKIEFVKI
jgi:hypothetical protein